MSKFFPTFPHREKVDNFREFPEGRKSYPLKGVIQVFSLTVKGERKAGLSSARRLTSPFLDKRNFNKQHHITICNNIKEVKIMNLIGEWTPEQQKEFQKEMERCPETKYHKGGKCINPHDHNLGCVYCSIEAGLYDPPKI